MLLVSIWLRFSHTSSFLVTTLALPPHRLLCTRDPQAKTYRIAPGTGTGETCCTSFWIKFSQRFQLLNPENEKYTAAIETAVYNALLRQMVHRPSPTAHNDIVATQKRSHNPPASSQSHGSSATTTASRRFRAAMDAWSVSDADPSLPPGIRYHAAMEGVQEHGNSGNTCCEGQGTRILGSLPELVPPLLFSCILCFCFLASLFSSVRRELK